MGKSLMRKVKLANGLVLEFHDASKKVAGGRWLVKLLARIEIPVNDYREDMPSGMDTNDIRKAVGENVVFEKNMERNFIDNKEKEKILNDFLDSFLDSSVPYLSVPNFPKQYILKKYGEAKARTNWYQE